MRLSYQTFLYPEIGEELLLLPHNTNLEENEQPVKDILENIREGKANPKILYICLTDDQWKKFDMDRLFNISYVLLHQQYKLPLITDEDFARYLLYLMAPILEHKDFNPIEYYNIDVTIKHHNINPTDYLDLNDLLNPVYSFHNNWPNKEELINSVGDVLLVPCNYKLLPFFNKL